MKKSYLALLILFSGSFLHAQSDWQLFRPDVQYLFSHPDAAYTESPVLGVKIGAEPCTTMYPALKWYGDWECNEVSTSFLGAEVCQTDSLTSFLMPDNTYFQIRQSATVGEQWPAWQWNGETVWGEVDEIRLSDFLGLSDSIKYIHFFTEDEQGERLFLPAYERPLLVSKQYGLIQGLWLRDFPDTTTLLPLIGLSEPQVGLQNIGRDDIFNLQVGDELHIQTYRAVLLPWDMGFYFEEKRLKATITQVEFNQASQVLRYVYTGPLLTLYSGDQRPQPDTIFQPSFSDAWLYDLSDFEYLNAQPGSLWSSGFHASVSIVQGQWGKISKFLTYPLQESTPPCLHVFTDGVSSIIYTEDIAGAYYSVNGLSGPSSRLLRYFRRDSVAFGTPYDFSWITADETIEETLEVTFGPNPTEGPLFVQLPLQVVADLKLYDAYGRLIEMQKQVQGQVRWNLQSFPAGIYQMVAFQKGQAVWRRGILKQE